LDTCHCREENGKDGEKVLLHSFTKSVATSQIVDEQCSYSQNSSSKKKV